jgi:DNA-binding PadR family transcriptional regulator
MPKSDTLGSFEQLVLGAVKTIQDAYAVPILKSVEDVSGKRINVAAVYVALERLQAKGYVTARMAEPTGRPGKQPKRFYTITETGENALRDAQETAARFLESLRPKPCETVEATPQEREKATI